jgi:hypothetical protein
MRGDGVSAGEGEGEDSLFVLSAHRFSLKKRFADMLVAQ